MSGRPFGEWLATRDCGFLDHHLIPADATLWRVERSEDSIVAREALILDRRASLFDTGDALPEPTLIT